MKKRKLYGLIGLTLFFSFFIIGCSLLAKPEDAVEEEMEKLKELDGEAIAKYLSYEDLFDYDTDEEISDDTKDVFDIILKEFDYEIIETEKVKKEATVTVKITALDMKEVIRDYMKSMIRYVMLGDIGDEEELGINELFSLLKEILADDYQTTTTDVDIHLIKEDGEWLVQADSQLASALTGHFSEIAEDPYLLTAEETAQLTLETIQAMDAETLHKFIMPGNVLSDDGSSETVLAEKIKQYFDFEILSCEEEGDVATVVVKITNINLSAILPRYEELLKEFANNYGGVMPSEEEIQNAANECFHTALKEAEETQENEVTINFTNDGSVWGLDANDEFVNVMRGGLNELKAALVEMNE